MTRAGSILITCSSIKCLKEITQELGQESKLYLQSNDITKTFCLILQNIVFSIKNSL